MRLALFDFDGTISSKDSLIDFIQFAIGKPKYYMGLMTLSPMLLAYTLKLISNHTAKERLIAYFFKDLDTEHLENITHRYTREQIDKITRPRALEKIKWHQEQGHKVVIVSASIECWLKGWCEKNNLDLIATRLEIRNSKFTGKLATRNCYGSEKVDRIRAAYDLVACDYIYAYGDSRGDKEMLALADEKFYRPFRK